MARTNKCLEDNNLIYTNNRLDTGAEFQAYRRNINAA